MTDAFTPHVRALLDRLEPPALSADFADRVVAQAEAQAVLPPLPPLRKPRLRRRFALAVGVAGLVGVAAAAAVVPADVWRKLPVVGGIVELISPANTGPPPAPALSEQAPVAPAVSEPAMPQAAPRAEPGVRSVPETSEAPPLAEDRAVAPPPVAEAGPFAGRPEPIERAREALPQPVREIPVAERPPPAETRASSATLVDTRAEPAPERVGPADTRETRQQIRERTATTRQTTRERPQRREPRTSRAD